jgi:hypothetical protein
VHRCNQVPVPGQRTPAPPSPRAVGALHRTRGCTGQPLAAGEQQYGGSVPDQRVRRLIQTVGESDDRVLRLCVLAVDTLEVSGAGLSVSSGAGHHRKVAATDEVSDRVEDLQVLLGQGPCVDALVTGAPVLAEDLSDAAYEQRWPMFTPAASAMGVRASFSVPLVVGELRLGAMDLYRTAAGPLHPPQVDEARDFATAAVNLLLDEQRSERDPHGPAAPGSSVVYQATGMVMVQLETDAESAFAALRARAYQEERSLQDVARDVLERRLRLTDEEV